MSEPGAWVVAVLAAIAAYQAGAARGKEEGRRIGEERGRLLLWESFTAFTLSTEQLIAAAERLAAECDRRANAGSARSGLMNSLAQQLKRSVAGAHEIGLDNL